MLQCIEAHLENIVKERKRGLFGTNYIKLLKLLLITPLLLCLLILPLWILFNWETEKNNNYDNFVQKCVALLVSVVGVMGTLDFQKPHISVRHFADANLQYLPLLGVISCAVYYLVVSVFEFKLYDILAYIAIFFAVLGALILPFVYAQHHTKMRFDPKKHNDCYSKINNTVHNTGSLTIQESSIFKITIKNIGAEPVDLSDLKLCRLSVDFTLPSYTLQPQEQLELVPETAPFEGQCLRIPGIHCFGTYDINTKVKTLLYRPGNDRIMTAKEHFHGSIEAEFIDTYEQIKDNSIVELHRRSLMTLTA